MPTIEVHLESLRTELILYPRPQLKPDNHRSCTTLMFSKRNRPSNSSGIGCGDAALVTRERVRPRRYEGARLKEKAVLAQRDPRLGGFIHGRLVALSNGGWPNRSRPRYRVLDGGDAATSTRSCCPGTKRRRNTQTLQGGRPPGFVTLPSKRRALLRCPGCLVHIAIAPNIETARPDAPNNRFRRNWSWHWIVNAESKSNAQLPALGAGRAWQV